MWLEVRAKTTDSNTDHSADHSTNAGTAKDGADSKSKQTAADDTHYAANNGTAANPLQISVRRLRITSITTIMDVTKSDTTTWRL